MTFVDKLSEIVSSDDEDDRNKDVTDDLTDLSWDPYTNTLEMSADPLPQPYRLIDNILQHIVNLACANGQEREDFRLGKVQSQGVVDVDTLPSVGIANADVLSDKKEFGSLDQQHLKQVTAMQASPDGRFVFAGAADGRLFAMSMYVEGQRQRSTLSATIVLSESPVSCLSIAGVGGVMADDGQIITNLYRVAWACENEVGVITINTSNWRLSQGCRVPFTHSSAITKVIISQDASFVAVAFEDGRLDVVDITFANPDAIEPCEPEEVEAPPPTTDEAHPASEQVETGVLSKTVNARTALAVLTKSLVDDKHLLLKAATRLSLPPPRAPTTTPCSLDPSGEGEGGGEVPAAPVPVDYHFLNVLAERKFSTPSRLQTCAICVFWKAELSWHRYELLPLVHSAGNAEDAEVKGKEVAGKAKDKDKKKEEEKSNDYPEETPADYTLYMPDSVSATALSPDTTLLAVGCENGSVVVYDNILMAEHVLLEPQGGAITSISFSGSNILLVGSEEGRVAIYTIQSLNDLERAKGYHTLDGTIGSMRLTDQLPGAVHAVRAVQGLPFAMLALEDGSRYVMDIDSGAVICKVFVTSTPPELEGDAVVQFARKGSLFQGPSLLDQLMTLVEIERSEEVLAPPAEEEKEEKRPKSKKEKKSATLHQPLEEEPAPPATIMQKTVVSRVGIYTVEHIVKAAYSSLHEAAQRQGKQHMTGMLMASTHTNRLQPGFFDNYEAPHSSKLNSLLVEVDDLPGSGRPGSGRPGSGSRGSGRPTSGGSNRSARSNRSTRSMRSTRSVGSHKARHPKKSKAPLEPPKPVIEHEDTPFNDMSQHVFHLLQEREQTRMYRNRRTVQRKEELQEQLDRERAGNRDD